MIQRFLDLTVMTKVIVTLLVKTLASTAVVGGVAYYLMTRSYVHLDAGYIDAIGESLIAGAVAATVVAMLVGVALGSRVSRRLKRLTRAVRAIEHGDLSQHVAVCCGQPKIDQYLRVVPTQN